MKLSICRYLKVSCLIHFSEPHRMARGRLLVFALLAAGMLGSIGCGAREAPPSEVKGRVGYRGGPLAGGLIVFVPDDERGNSGPLVKGTIQPDGSFSLGSSLPPGWYRVAVAPLPGAGRTTPTAADPYPGPPVRYRNPQLSGLEGEVKAGAENVFDFQLNDA
jgi:hypothetical protein